MDKPGWILVTLLILGNINMTLAEEEKASATITELTGKVEIKPEEETEWITAELYMPLDEEDTIKTGAKSSVEITLDDGTVIKIEEKSELNLTTLSSHPKKKRSFWKLLFGRLLANVQPGSELEVKTPTALASVRGTEFVVDIPDKNTTNIGVFDGTVGVRHFEEKGKLSKKEILVRPNMQTAVKFRKRPSRPFALTKAMSFHKKKILLLRKRAKLNRSRIKEFIKRRKELRKRRIQRLKKLRQQRLKKLRRPQKIKKGRQIKRKLRR